jgi:hypothetical protein
LIQGGTALLDASYEGHDEVVRLLLMAGADVNVPQANVCIVSCSSTYSFYLQFTVDHMVGTLLWSCMNDVCSTNFIHVHYRPVGPRCTCHVLKAKSLVRRY